MKRLLAEVMTDASTALQDGLKLYWPSEGPNEMAEANALFAVGTALRSRGYLIFSEVRCSLSGELGHIDMFAIDVQNKVGIGIEGKRLYNVGGAASLLADWTRLGEAKFASEYKPLPEIRARYRMLVATTWTANIKDWWKSPTAAQSGGAWNLLGEELGAALALGAERIQEDPVWTTQWLLFALGRRAPCFFTEVKRDPR